jgi:putative nucleotidyltransferase with HDIG domain
MKSTPPRRKKALPLNTLSRILLFAGSFLAVVFILSFEPEVLRWKQHFRQSEPAPRTYFAPFALSVVDHRATEVRKDTEVRAVPDVYDVDGIANKSLMKSLEDFLALLGELQAAGLNDSALEALKINIPASTVKTLAATDVAFIGDVLREMLAGALEEGVIDFQTKMELVNEGKRAVALRGAEGEKETVVKEIRTREDVLDQAGHVLSDRVPKNRKLRSAMAEALREFVRTNVVYNEGETKARKESASAQASEVFIDIKRNQMIVQRGGIVTPEIWERIEEIEGKRITKQIQLKVLGTGLITLVAFIVLGCYLYFFERKIFSSVKKQLLIHSTLVLVLAVERLIVNLPYPFAPYLLPASAYSLCLALLLHPRMGLAGGMIVAVFNALLTEFTTAAVYLYSFFGSVVASFSAIRLAKRSQFLSVGAAVGLANFGVIFGTQVLSGAGAASGVELGVYGIAGGFLLSIPLVFIVLPILENVFGLVTDITLLELSDLNHPLLRRMVIEAPGTYHHSLVVSTLAEAACKAIGANSLLARVGAYFHDIGKLENPQFFTENQLERERDQHKTLSPETSYRIIANHVSDGIELARKYKLKDAIIDFIPQHQGTCPVYYFFKKAEESHASKEKINIDDYRYPGPKPQLKETAVVLLADSVEAASRSLASVTPQSVEELVTDIINWKLIDGQLDECDLTLTDVRKIQDSFTHNLLAILHTRVQYPKSDVEPLWQKIVGRKTDLSRPYPHPLS